MQSVEQHSRLSAAQSAMGGRISETSRRPSVARTHTRRVMSGFVSLCLIYLFSLDVISQLTIAEALPLQQQHQQTSENTGPSSELVRRRRALDTLDGDDFSLKRKRALDTLDGDDFSLKRKRALDVMEGDGFGFEKRALDSLEGEGFGGLRKRALDSLDGDGFAGFTKKRALDMLEGDGFAGFNKRALDVLEGDDFSLKRKRALDALEGNGFGLDKRTVSQHESRLRRAIDQLNRFREQALAERIQRSFYNTQVKGTMKRALDALEGNGYGF